MPKISPMDYIARLQKYAERNKIIREQRRSGMSYGKIAKAHKISRARAHQLVKRGK